MRWRHWTFAAVVAAGLCPRADAGFIFNRKPKANPAEAVPALIMQLKTDKDEGRRAAAAEELRQFDPKANPEINTVLIDALLKDASPAVRSEAASTIAKLRPVNQQAGFALEQAAANDPAMRVRMSARQSLWQYNLLGYRSGRPTETADAKKGPQLLPPPAPSQPHMTAKPRNGRNETPEPPLADGGTTSLKPADPPKLRTPPPTTDPQGPKLIPPG